MSYVITVKRANDKPSLSLTDFNHLTQRDISLSRSDSGSIVWTQPGSNREFQINIESDHLWSDEAAHDGGDALLEKFRGIAKELDARVFGEEGEDITDEHSDTPLGAKNTVLALGGLLLAILSAPLLLLWAVFRVPWMIFKIRRTTK